MKTTPPIFLLGVVVLGAACLVPDVNLDGKACSTSEPCADGYQCANAVCVLPGDIVDAGGTHPDAGSDAGSPDSGIPDSTATLEGINAYTVGGVFDDSTLAGPTRGNNVSIYIGKQPISCNDESTALDWLMEIDAVATTVPSFGTGTYPVANADGGVEISVHLTNSTLGTNYDSSSPTPSNQIRGSLTFSNIQPDYISGTLAFTVGLPDGGNTPLTGSFTANDNSCQ